MRPRKRRKPRNLINRSPGRLTAINLKILLPFQVYCEETNVQTIVAHTYQGSFGLLPHRLDCCAALAPGILCYQVAGRSETYLAVDQGVLVKAGMNVLVSVRNAIGGTDLDKLHETVKREFVHEDEEERNVRTVLAKMETGFIRRLMEFESP